MKNCHDCKNVFICNNYQRQEFICDKWGKDEEQDGQNIEDILEQVECDMDGIYNDRISDDDKSVAMKNLEARRNLMKSQLNLILKMLMESNEKINCDLFDFCFLHCCCRR